MKVMTVLGTRPEIIRLSRIIPQLDRACDHVLVHTGQNYSASLSDLFFEEMGVRAPDYALGVRGGSFAEQAGQILERAGKVIADERPDRIVILGDTNSGLAALVAKRMGIGVYHLEAGNRCFDDRVPEEVNRRVIDHASDVLMPYTRRSRENLLREGFRHDDVFVIGNPIGEVLAAHGPKIDASDVLDQLELTPGGYVLVTLHRAENVDLEPRLRRYAEALERVSRALEVPVIVSLHPRTRDRMAAFGLPISEHGAIRHLPPFGFFDFVALEKMAGCVLTDSGTVQEECCILGVPNVTLRDVTERPETLECGSNVLAGDDPELIEQLAVRVVNERRQWEVPDEYAWPDVADTAVRLVLGFRLGARR